MLFIESEHSEQQGEQRVCIVSRKNEYEKVIHTCRLVDGISTLCTDYDNDGIVTRTCELNDNNIYSYEKYHNGAFIERLHLKNYNCRADNTRRFILEDFHGKSESFENGIKMSESNYVNGKKCGLDYSCYDDGKVFWLANKENDVFHGYEILWHKNGQMKASRFWNNGDYIHGTHKEYTESGRELSSREKRRWRKW